MTASENHTQTWNEWNSSGGPRYPHEKVVQFTFRNFPSEQRLNQHVLDLGCGGGVHCVFFAREGFSVTGTDLSSVGINHARRWLDQEGFEAEFLVESCDELRDVEKYDLVVSIGVFECAGLKAAERTAPRVSRSLREGGRGLFLFASEDDFRVAEKNSLGLYGYSRSEVEAIFESHFRVVWIDRYITTYRGGREQQNEWLVTVEQ